jgi:hypothetical protein
MCWGSRGGKNLAGAHFPFDDITRAVVFDLSCALDVACIFYFYFPTPGPSSALISLSLPLSDV